VGRGPLRWIGRGSRWLGGSDTTRCCPLAVRSAPLWCERGPQPSGGEPSAAQPVGAGPSPATPVPQAARRGPQTGPSAGHEPSPARSRVSRETLDSTPRTPTDGATTALRAGGTPRGRRDPHVRPPRERPGDRWITRTSSGADGGPRRLRRQLPPQRAARCIRDVAGACPTGPRKEGSPAVPPLARGVADGLSRSRSWPNAGTPEGATRPPGPACGTPVISPCGPRTRCRSSTRAVPVPTAASSRERRPCTSLPVQRRVTQSEALGPPTRSGDHRRPTIDCLTRTSMGAQLRARGVMVGANAPVHSRQGESRPGLIDCAAARHKKDVPRLRAWGRSSGRQNGSPPRTRRTTASASGSAGPPVGSVCPVSARPDRLGFTPP
jgi:hypothetical protein